MKIIVEVEIPNEDDLCVEGSCAFLALEDGLYGLNRCTLFQETLNLVDTKCHPKCSEMRAREKAKHENPNVDSNTEHQDNLQE